uniref:Acylphosphatase n=1 Tax=Laticauda laticaudata TaxID=8630 RepID=A0A8C5S1Z7_LATLA
MLKLKSWQVTHIYNDWDHVITICNLLTSKISGEYTEDKARKAGVVGWVKNTRQGTVTGQVQVHSLVCWLASNNAISCSNFKTMSVFSSSF